MKIIKPYYVIEMPIDGKKILQNIERIGRVCYKSESRITDDSAEKFVAMLIKNRHEAMIEHESITVRFICDRGIMAELTRHRLSSFAVESTRYNNYSDDKFGNELTFIEPCFFKEYDDTLESNYVPILKPNDKYKIWFNTCCFAEDSYLQLLKNGATPQEARTVLPNSLKTEIVMTANLREWRHFFKLRTSPAAHPQCKELSIPLLQELKTLIPIVFDDIIVKECK